MAVNAAVTTETGAPCVPLKAFVPMQRTIDFAATGLSLIAGAWFELFTPPAKSVAVCAAIEVLTVDAGGGSVTLGKGAGTELSTAVAVASLTLAANTNTAPVVFNAVPVCLAATAATLTTAKVRVTVWFALADDFKANS